jgi:SAM-dependent methyltransferase
MAIGSNAARVRRGTDRKLPPFEVDPAREARCETALREFLTYRGQHPVEQNVQQLITLDGGFVSRFNYFVPRIPPAAFRHLLISGSAAGSEMIVARRFGFQRVCGTEVRQEYVDITNARLSGNEGFEAIYYDGQTLPYADRLFSMIISGHIIEHTPSPYDYLREHMRVLEPGGHLFIEFPNRYHWLELHTRQPSVEWLPRRLRSLALNCLASRLAPLPREWRRRYGLIHRTLQPVSVWQIKGYLSQMGCRQARILHRYAPAWGFVRMLIVK